MAIVTDIKQQRRSKGRFSVYLDGKYGFAMSSLDLGTSAIRVGQELTLQQIEAFRTDYEESRAYNMSIQYVGVRPRSVKEINDYLLRKGFDEGLAMQVIERLKGHGLLDDREFAAAWVTDRHKLIVT